MGNFYMEATQINYRRDDKPKTVDQKLQELSETSAIDTDIAPVFKSTNTYQPGDMVYYCNKLYVFNVEHTGTWAAADVTETDVTTEISSLKSGLTNLIVLRHQTITVESIPANSSVTTPYQPETVSGYSWAGFTPIVKTDGVMITIGWIGNAFRIIARNFNNSNVTNVDVEINWIFVKSA